MKKILLIAVLSVLVAGPAHAYDKKMAKSYEAFFSDFVGKNSSRQMQLITAKSLVESQVKGDNLFILDVRTPGETAVYGFNLPNSMAVPVNEVFGPDNLEKIPANMKVVVVCKGGMRAMSVATGLRHIGFKNVFVLKQGFAGLADYLSPKNAYQ